MVTLVTQGPAAAWDKIQDQLSSLKDQVIGGIIDLVVDTVVKKAIPKLLSFFVPGAGFISAIISIYDTIMVFVQKLSKMVQVVTGFIDSIVAIAGGAIDSAAQRVEGALASVLSLAINFLAGFAGLGNVADKILGVINKIRATVDKSLDALIAWIVQMAKSLFAKGKAAIKGAVNWAFATKPFKMGEEDHTLLISDEGVLTIESTPQAARKFVAWYLEKNDNEKNRKLAAEITPLITQAQKIASKIAEAAPARGKTPAPAKQAELLAISAQITELLAKMVGSDGDIGDLVEKYWLEGQVGTYATTPKPVGDKLTPDHQPQASLILAVRDFFAKRKIASPELAARAESRAAQGYTINLHFNRHIAGATYGGKGRKSDDVYEELMKSSGSKPKEEARIDAVKLLKAALKFDVKTMKEAVANKDVTQPPWTDLAEALKPKGSKKAPPRKKIEELRAQIAARVVAGEDQIANQPLDF